MPRSLDNVTVAPPKVKLFPEPSFNCTVMVDGVVLSAVTDVGEAVRVEVAMEAAPGTKLTVSLSVMPEPASVPVIVVLPAVTEDVSKAVYVPLLWFVTTDNDPAVVDNVTIPPVVAKLLLFPSFS